MTTDKLEQMLAEGKDSPLLRFGLGNAYCAKKNFVQAAIHFEACVKQEPEYSAAWKMLGRSRMSTGQSKEAQAAFEHGLAAAIKKGDKQTEREIQTFMKKLAKRASTD